MEILKKSSVLLAAALSVLLLLSACATSPERRISRNPELFASFPADVQENIREGRVDIGYTKDMVRLALGEPNRVVTRRTADEVHESWIYLGTYITTDTYHVRDHGRFSTFDRRNVIVDRTRQNTFERMRLTFSEGELSAIEQLER